MALVPKTNFPQIQRHYQYQTFFITLSIERLENQLAHYQDL